jgi:hypothetical protein
MQINHKIENGEIMLQMQCSDLRGQGEVFHSSIFRHVQRMQEESYIKKKCEEKING